MSKEKRTPSFSSLFGARFAPILVRKQVGKAAVHLATLAVAKARRKLLIAKRLWVFEF